MKHIGIAALLVFIVAISQGQMITTIAGNGVASNSGDGGQAINATLNYPVGAIFDKFGNYYFTLGVSGNGVRKIASNGIITTVAGGGTGGDGILATLSNLDNAQGVAVDTFGNLYIADGNHHKIRKVDVNTGIISTIAGTGTAGYSGDGGLAIAAELNYPPDVACDKEGNVFVADFVNGRVRKIEVTTGVISTIATMSARGVCVDSVGNVFAADNIRVIRINSLGVIDTIAGGGMGGDGGLAIDAFTNPWRICFDKIGNLYICETGQNKIRKIDVSGIITTVAGTGVAGSAGDGGPATQAQINYPGGVAVDTCGNLYIGEAHGYRIRKVEFNPPCFPLAVPVLGHMELSIYPNPAQGKIIIKGYRLEQLSVINMIGQQVLEMKLSKHETEVDINGLMPGMYIFKIKGSSGEVVTRKVMKE